jgi:hypothetical protein
MKNPSFGAVEAALIKISGENFYKINQVRFANSNPAPNFSKMILFKRWPAGFCRKAF